MDELSELKGRMRALRNMKKARLVNLPKLSVMVLRFAFVDVKELEMENASLLESHEVLGEVMRKKREEERRREEEEKRREKSKLGHLFTFSFSALMCYWILIFAQTYVDALLGKTGNGMGRGNVPCAFLWRGRGRG